MPAGQGVFHTAPAPHRARSFSFSPSSARLFVSPFAPPNLDSIEPLDLPPTLPLCLLVLRQFLRGHVIQVEQRLQSLASQLAATHSDTDSSSDDADDHFHQAPRLALPHAPLIDFVQHVSAYVDQLKLDLFGSSCPLAFSSTDPLAIGLETCHDPLVSPLPEIKLRQMFNSFSSIPDPTNLVQRLTLHAEKVQQVLSQLSIFSSHPSLIKLPDFFPPELTFFAFKNLSINDEKDSTHLDGLRNYFRAESERLSSLIIPTSITNSITHSSNSLTSTLLAYKHEAKLAFEGGENFIREEGEKLKEWVDAETESLRLALHAGASRLLTYHELPHEWKNNRFILSGYRFIPLDRWKELLYSGLQWHNETINIHTHFIGTLSLLYLLAFLWPITPHTNLSSSTIGDRLISLLFIVCAIKCLVCSTAWHLFAGCGTLGPFRRLACVDYVGISGLIAASVISAEYYGFYCRPGLASFYITFTAATGLIGMVLPFQPFFDKPESKHIRIVFFVSMACSCLIPQAHMAALYGIYETIAFYRPAIPSVISYLSGLFFYASNCPERIRPGWVFDTLGHSHQFWHIAIVVAIWLHWRAIGSFHEIGRTSFSCADQTLMAQSAINQDNQVIFGKLLGGF